MCEVARRIAIVLGIGVVLAGLVSVFSDSGPAASSSCQANLVRYEWNARAAGAPWLGVRAGRSRLEGYLYTYDEYLGDRRVNRSERVVLRAGKAEKIAWFSTTWGGSRLTVTAKRLDGPGAFSRRFRATHGAGFYPSGIRIPTAGCWQLTLRTKGWLYRVIVEAVDPAPPDTCDPTPVPPSGWVDLVPARSEISAGWGWRTEEGGALLYTGGRTPDGGNTKVLWRSTQPGGSLLLRGSEIGGNGAFRATFNEVSPRGHWPSHVTVPTPGCWLFTAHGIGKAAGIVVARVSN